MTKEQKAEPVTLELCPTGLFSFNGTVCGFKTEYRIEVPENSGRWWPDAYCLESGEVFWGGTTLHEDRARLMVVPVGGIRSEDQIERAAEALYLDRFTRTGEKPAYRWRDPAWNVDSFWDRFVQDARAVIAAVTPPVGTRGEEG